MPTESQYLNIILDDASSENERGKALSCLKKLTKEDRNSLVGRYLAPALAPAKPKRSTSKKTKFDLEEDLRTVSQGYLSLKTQLETAKVEIASLKANKPVKKHTTPLVIKLGVYVLIIVMLSTSLTPLGGSILLVFVTTVLFHIRELRS